LPDRRTVPDGTTPGDLTFAAFGALWLERARRGHVKDVHNASGHLRRLGGIEIAPGERLGDRPIGRVTEDDLERAFKGLATLANGT
jgi:hypothetical protein